MSDSEGAYRDLERRFRRLSLLNEARGLLGWDWATMMPEASAESRAETMAELGLIAHDMMTDPPLADLLAAAEDAAVTLDHWQRANLSEMRRLWRHANAVPARLVEALSRAGSACEMAWRAARPADDFEAVAPRLRDVIAQVREQAAAKADALDCTPYDALLDQYEPGGRSDEIEAIFDDLADFLPAFTAEVLERQAGESPVLPLDGPFPIDRQRALGERLMKAAGFPFDQGRLDVSLHPFSGGTPDDLRITTRYDEADFTSAVMAVLHETGHALYERGLPRAWRHQPVGEARGMSVHESQSLLMEMQACRSAEFIGFAAPLMRDAFGRDGPAWQTDNLARLYTRVERGLIRVDADEVTYPTHVILRYRLERRILAGDLEVDDLPGAWREAMAELVGVTPDDDRDGCMQDIHWMDGTFGYFPTYTLGAMMAAQLFDAARRAEADVMPGLARGDFAPLQGWLRTNVHELGSSLTTAELLTQATGRPLDPAIYKRHLAARYLG
jgi:carboxypeptidase Taq